VGAALAQRLRALATRTPAAVPLLWTDLEGFYLERLAIAQDVRDKLKLGGHSRGNGRTQNEERRSRDSD
jgi:hypothetical protein